MLPGNVGVVGLHPGDADGGLDGQLVEPLALLGAGEAGPGGERTSAVASRQLRAPAVDTAASGHSVTRHSRAAASH